MAAHDLRDALETRLESLARRALRPVDVAVIDSGIDASHPDLAGRIGEAYRVKTGAGGARLRAIRADTNQDAYGHGTAVASIIGRIAPNARLIDLRVLEPGNIGTADALFVALQAALDRRWKLVNMSLAASPAVARRLMPLCERAHFQGQVLVAARRNLPIHDDGYPASFSSVLGVDAETVASPYSYFFKTGAIEWNAVGDWVSVAAAGGGYTAKTGTSFATPAITGICALLLGAFPELTPFEIKTILKAHAQREREPKRTTRRG